MVKRQTVWLSTMMVFSLMLIGYYTLGTPTASTPKSNTGTTGNNSAVVSTGPATGTLPASTQVGGKAMTTVGSSKGTPTTSASSQQPSDWFVQTTMNMTNSQEKVIQVLQNTLSDPRANNLAVSKAFEELTALQTQTANAQKVHAELQADGYPDSVVIFNPHNTVHVYVEASSITPEAAVRVINLASQTLGVQSNLITVSSHS